MRLQELRAFLQVRQPDPQKRRMLLWSRVHVRSRLPVPGLLRLRYGEEEVSE